VLADAAKQIPTPSEDGANAAEILFAKIKAIRERLWPGRSVMSTSSGMAVRRWCLNGV